ncbi:MAG: hypothetical protein AAF628_37325 [Planctomycetota bacterium]
MLAAGRDDQGNYYSDTWQWDGIHWTQLSAPGPQLARGGCGMAYEPASGGFVVTGQVQWTLRLPNNFSLVGQKFYQQALHLGPAGLTGGAVSNAGEAMIGK